MSTPASIVILGKLPPPHNGPSIATGIILRSKLREQFDLHHVDTRAHESLQTIGAWSVSKVVRNCSIYVELARVLRRRRPDLLLVPISQSTIGFVKDSVFILTARALRIKVLIQLRGSALQNWLKGANPLVRWYATRVMRSTAGAIVLGEKLRPVFRGLIPDDRVFVVPNGGDYVFPASSSRGGAVTRFLYLANLKGSKGIEELTQAVALLIDRGLTGFHVDVVGEWVDRRTQQTCQGLVDRRGLPMTFHGAKYDADKLAFLSGADAFVFVPREPEGHPWVIVEALAAGLPIIATDQGAITESVVHDDNGFIVQSSPAAIADAMQRFTTDRDLLPRMGAASARRHAAHFTEARMVERLGGVFSAVIRAHP
jgi:glycosyltransferase involved in cell wall biosynthesis